MRREKLLLQLVFLFLAIAFISCNNPQVKQEKHEAANQSSLEETLKKNNSIIEDAIYKNDYETLLEYYTDDAIIVANLQPTLRGKIAIRDSYMEQKKDEVKTHSFRAVAERIWESGNEIYEYGTYGLTISSKKTTRPYAYTGSFFLIWEKQSTGKLLIKYFISNLDFNPC
jgi:ketosteroid isomerase-like protein